MALRNAGFFLPTGGMPSWPARNRHQHPQTNWNGTPGDIGEVTELVTVTGAGHQYAIRFANGYEVEAVQPSTVVSILAPDDAPEPR